MRRMMLILAALALLLPAAAARAQGAVSVRLGVLSGAAQAAIVVGVQKGFFAKHGFDVQMRPLVGGVQGTQAIASGQVDWSAGGIEPTIVAASNGLPFKPYAMYAKGGDSYGVLARRAAGIKSVADLQGHKVALTPGTAPVQGFEDLLAANKVPPDSILRVNSTFTMMGQMLVGGSVDAIVGIEPYLTLTQMKMNGQGVMLARLGRYVQGGGLFYISNAWTKAHPTMVEPAIAALWQAEQFVRHNPEQAATLMATFIKADPAVVKATFRYLTFDPTIDDFTSRSFDATAKYLLKEGHIPQLVTASAVLAPAVKMDETLRRSHPEYLQ